MKDIKKEIQSQIIKQQIKSLLDKQQSESISGFTTDRSAKKSEYDGTQNQEISHQRFSSQLKKSTPSSSNDIGGLRSILKPLLSNKHIDLTQKTYFSSPQNSTMSTRVNQVTSYLISPMSTFNQKSSSKVEFKNSENNIHEDNEIKMNLTKNNYHEYLQNEINESISKISQNDIIQTSQNQEKDQRLSRRPSISMQQIITENQLQQTKKTNSFHEDPKYETYQNKLLEYSQSKIRLPKVNPEYFVLAQQVFKNQKFMSSRNTTPTQSMTERLKRNTNSDNLKDFVDNYKKTVDKLITDRQELNRTKNRFNKGDSHNLSLIHSPLRRQINSLGRQQRIQQQDEREYFSSLFEGDENIKLKAKQQNLDSSMSKTKIDFKQVNLNKNLQRLQKLKEHEDIQQYSQTLLSKGMIKPEECSALDTKLKIQKFFLKKDITYEQKKISFKKLMNEFNPKNLKYPIQKSTEIIQMLISMKPFYFDKINNPTQFPSQQRNSFRKESSSTTTMGMTQLGLTSQTSTFHKTHEFERFKAKILDPLNSIKQQSPQSNFTISHREYFK